MKGGASSHPSGMFLPGCWHDRHSTAHSPSSVEAMPEGSWPRPARFSILMCRQMRTMGRNWSNDPRWCYMRIKTIWRGLEPHVPWCLMNLCCQIYGPKIGKNHIRTISPEDWQAGMSWVHRRCMPSVDDWCWWETRKCEGAGYVDLLHRCIRNKRGRWRVGHSYQRQQICRC